MLSELDRKMNEQLRDDTQTSTPSVTVPPVACPVFGLNRADRARRVLCKTVVIKYALAEFI